MKRFCCILENVCIKVECSLPARIPPTPSTKMPIRLHRIIRCLVISSVKVPYCRIKEISLAE